MGRWVSISPKAAGRLLTYGRLHAETGAERIGVLVGYRGLILDAIEMTSNSSHCHAVLDDRKLLQILPALNARLFIVGWWHTHLEDPHPSHIDLKTQAEWQAVYEDSVAAIVSAERMAIVLWRIEDGKPVVIREVRNLWV